MAEPEPARPIEGPLWVIAVFFTGMTEDLPPGQHAIWTSNTLVDRLREQDCVYRHYAIGQGMTERGQITAPMPWARAALKVGLPALVFVVPDGQVVSSGPLPDDESGVLTVAAAVRRLGR